MPRTLPGQAAGTSDRKAVSAGRIAISALAAALGTGSLGSNAAAEGADPRLPQRFVTAPPAGAAVSERLTPEGTNLSPVPLPGNAHVGWQVRLAGPLLGAPLALAGERLLIAHGRGRLSELDRAGRTLWSVRTGADLLGGPIALGSGLRLAVTRDADVVSVDPNGGGLRRERLPLGELEGNLVSIPTADGGALLGIGARLIRLGPRGGFSWTTPTPDPVRALFEWRGKAIAVGRNGTVLARGPVGALHEIANLATPVRAALLVDRRVWLLAGERQLVELDLETERHQTRLSDSSLDFVDLASGAPGTLRLLTRRGILLGVDATGRETARVTLLPDAVAGEAAALVVDARGAALAAFAGAPLVHVTPQGDSMPVAGTACPEPLRPTPLAPGLVVAACRSGLLRALSDTAR